MALAEQENKPRHFWARGKMAAVFRLLRGQDLKLLSQELGVTAAALSQ